MHVIPILRALDIIGAMPLTDYQPSPVKVILIDDHYLIHESVTHQLSSHPEIQLVATGIAGEQIEPLIEEHHPKVVLLDLGIPAKVGATIRQAGRFPVLPAIRRLRPKYPETHFIILSADIDSSLIDAALDVEVKGYLLKDDELSVQLPDAIRAVSKGGVYFSKEVAHQIMTHKPARPRTELTPQQFAVLNAIVSNANLPYVEHARTLGIAEDTFRNHLRAIFEKLGASNITFALIRAIQLGLIPPHLLGLRYMEPN